MVTGSLKTNSLSLKIVSLELTSHNEIVRSCSEHYNTGTYRPVLDKVL